jgi:pimeloyl-ACP methyl ester carboxylesterase
VSWARRAGIAGVALGVVATGVAVERLTVSRSVRRQARLALDASAPFGTLRGTPGTAFADDGTELYYEIDEPTDDGAGEGPGNADDGGPTVVFSHGYCLAQDSWHFQRAAMRAANVRAVYWDQRCHGRSERGRDTPDGREPVSIDQLGRDLLAVLHAAVPDGPVVLVGHSMGGMTMMALADQFPEYVARRVAGVAFLATSAGELADVTYGFPAPAARALRRVLPGVLRVMSSQVALVERGRRAVGDAYAGIVRRYAFGDTRAVDPAVARFAERMIDAVPVDVVAEFYPAFGLHDKSAALAVFGGLDVDLPLLVLAGERDLMTPPEHSERIAAALPRADLVLVPDAGHLVPLEAPDTVNERLGELVARSILEP